MFRSYSTLLLQRLVTIQEPINFSDLKNETDLQSKIATFLSGLSINQNPLFPDDPTLQTITLAELQKVVISKLQENIRIRRITTYTSPNGLIGSYVHNSPVKGLGNSACLLKVGGTKDIDLADNLAAQVLGSKPKYFYKVSTKIVTCMLNLFSLLPPFKLYFLSKMWCKNSFER